MSARAGWASAAAAAVVLSGGCASSRPLFVRYVEEGLYEDATRAFENDTTLWNRPDALLLAGRMFANPSLPVFEPTRARAALERLAERFPESPEATESAPLLPLLTALAEVKAELAAQSAKSAESQRLLGTQADTLAATQQAAALERETLQRRIRRLETELDEARRELERLKAIDLRRRPEGRR